MTTADVLNPMQQAVVDALTKEATWEPLPRDIVESLRQRLHDGVAEIAEHLTPDNALWVSKHKLTTVHGCEANHLAGLDGFSWTLANVRGTVLHKAVELGANWRGVIVPADVVDAALDHLAEDERESAGPFIYGLPASDRAQLRSNAIDLYTKFDECFPPLKAAWPADFTRVAGTPANAVGEYGYDQRRFWCGFAQAGDSRCQRDQCER